jgi:3-oxoacyl-[acyl-carrier protein] reductase
VTARPLQGKRVLITGASRGIGAATARAVYRDGGYVIAHYGTNRDAVQALAAEFDDDRIQVQGDLTDPAETRSVWRESVHATGRIDVLVNNAGAWIASPIDDDAAWDDGWARNLAFLASGRARHATGATVDITGADYVR